MTPTDYALIITCATATVAALMHAWKSWVTLGTRHTWTDPVNRLAARITATEQRITNLEEHTE